MHKAEFKATVFVLLIFLGIVGLALISVGIYSQFFIEIKLVIFALGIIFLISSGIGFKNFKKIEFG
jgi:hypothetical protein